MDSSISGCSGSWSLVVVLVYCCLLSVVSCLLSDVLRVYWVRAKISPGLILRQFFWAIVNFLFPRHWNVWPFISLIPSVLTWLQFLGLAFTA